MVFEILPVACMYSVLDMEIPFCATVISFYCMFTINLRRVSYCKTWIWYRGVDKSLARPGRKQAWKHVRDVHSLNSIKTQAVTEFFFPARQGAKGNSCYSDRNIGLFPSWSG